MDENTINTAYAGMQDARMNLFTANQALEKAEIAWRRQEADAYNKQLLQGKNEASRAAELSALYPKELSDLYQCRAKVDGTKYLYDIAKIEVDRIQAVLTFLGLK